MRLILITTLLLISPTLVIAEPVYLWIKKSDEQLADALPNNKGDVMAITPATAQYEPTVSELVHVFVVKVDLTKEEQNNLMVQDTKEETIDFEGEKVPKTTVINERKNKLDVDALVIKEAKEEFTKNEITSKIIDKSAVVVIDTP